MHRQTRCEGVRCVCAARLSGAAVPAPPIARGQGARVSVMCDVRAQASKNERRGEAKAHRVELLEELAEQGLAAPAATSPPQPSQARQAGNGKAMAQTRQTRPSVLPSSQSLSLHAIFTKATGFP